MKLTPENAFLGAKVTYKEKEHCVVKINAKSLYISSNPKFLELWEERPKGTKWKVFCEKKNAFQTKYDNVEISEEEAQRKTEVLAEEKKKKERKQIVSRDIEKQLVQAMKKGLKGKNYKYVIEGTSGRIFPVSMNKEKAMALFHDTTNQVWAFYDMKNDMYLPFKKEEHKNGKEIIWPEYEPPKVEA